MFKRFISTVIASLGISGLVGAQQHFTIGRNEITAPAGWSQISKDADKLVLRSNTQHQQATITILPLAADATFDDFKRLCQHRIEAERKELNDGSIYPEQPKAFQESDGFGLFYSGEDKKTHRLFSAYLGLAHREFLTIYVESINVASKDHFSSFKVLVDGLKRN